MVVSDPEAGEVKIVIERKEHNDYYQDLTTSKTIRSLDWQAGLQIRNLGPDPDPGLDLDHVLYPNFVESQRNNVVLICM
jgi:hypothetical protein